MIKRCLIIGGINPNDKSIEKYTETQRANQAANSRWMWNLIKGFEAEGFEVSVLNTPNIPSYQEDHICKYHQGYFWHHNENAEDYCISFCNLFPLSIISRKNQINKYLKKWLKNTDGYKVVIGITPHFPIVYNLNKYAPKVETCLVVPDLPEYTGASRKGNAIYRLLKGIDIQLFYKSIKNINSFVILTDEMKNKLGRNKNYLRIECMIDPELANYQKTLKASADNELTILYSGTISENYGVYDVAKAIHESNMKCVFYICGDGTGVKKLKNDFSDDDRIQYLGSISPEKVIALQRKVDVLINPRPNDGSEYLLYSFPSKTLEYLAAAKPVICHKLPSIPDEYDPYLFYLKDNTVKSVTDMISRMMNMTEEERNAIGYRNRDFIVENKNYCVQAKKIATFLSRE